MKALVFKGPGKRFLEGKPTPVVGPLTKAIVKLNHQLALDRVVKVLRHIW